MTTPRTEHTIAGIVLAGGQSRRMGRDKAMMRWNKGSLLAHMQGLLLAAGADPVRVSGAYPAFDGIRDEIPDQGPLGGLHSVLKTLPDGPAWVVPVDMPLLGVALLHELRDAASSPCVIIAGHPMPMRLDINSRARAVVEALLDDADGPRSLRALQRLLGVLELAHAGPSALPLFNCNTPEQWKELVP